MEGAMKKIRKMGGLKGLAKMFGGGGLEGMLGGGGAPPAGMPGLGGNMPNLPPGFQNFLKK
jgi:signal recognition particle subunit SRP54